MVSLPEELQAREAVARQRVVELEAEAAELADRLERARKELSRLEITRGDGRAGAGGTVGRGGRAAGVAGG